MTKPELLVFSVAQRNVKKKKTYTTPNKIKRKKVKLVLHKRQLFLANHMFRMIWYGDHVIIKLGWLFVEVDGFLKRLSGWTGCSYLGPESRQH
ncbi:7245_t:CDS:2 [Paraglomus occultum]|uniref:7245_t:CDS:1 n=1 Tax=Paraglomus occultum TaxID=144539 RepID=A0A9N9FXD8_9GLOM|nr:7245_t:CDS:2 [Paraglomus occultum]